MNKKLLPLALLEANDKESVEGITRFMKLVFLAQEEGVGQEFFEYEPNQYGPYSKEFYDDLDKLVATGFVERDNVQTGSGNDKQVYRLTSKGERALRGARKENDLSELTAVADSIKSEYNSIGLWDLLEYVYGKYPDMAEDSVLDISPEKAI